MAFNLRNVVVGLAAGASLALAGCGGGFDCSAASKCSADPQPTQASIDACNTELNDATCGDKFKALGQCEQDNQKCTSDNTTDPTGFAACATQVSDWSSCKAGGGSSSGSTGGSGSGSGSGSTGA